MPDGHDLSNELDFETHIKEMDDRALMEFTAREVYETCQLTQNHEQRIGVLENIGRKTFGVSNGISTIIGGAVIAVINYFTGKTA